MTTWYKVELNFIVRKILCLGSGYSAEIRPYFGDIFEKKILLSAGSPPSSSAAAVMPSLDHHHANENTDGTSTDFGAVKAIGRVCRAR